MTDTTHEQNTTHTEPRPRVECDLEELMGLLGASVQNALHHSGLADDPRAQAVADKALARAQAVLGYSGAITRQIR